ncbi:hypothetical protein ASD54_03650 [Rhizobium sp. Root149]|nr:hypothetical protein ASD54_03650 [Rhizobium sp. Root149]
MLSFGAALAGDILSILTPGGGLFSKLADEYLAKKNQEAVDVAIEELSFGRVEFHESDIQPFVAVLLRYSKAASEGAARRNLRLLMQIVVGLKRNRSLSEEAFRRWAGVLEHMTRDELMFVGHAVRFYKEIVSGTMPDDIRFWGLILKSMQNSGYQEEETSAIAAAVSRSGLFIPLLTAGGLSYKASPRLAELTLLIDSESLVKDD